METRFLSKPIAQAYVFFGLLSLYKGVHDVRRGARLSQDGECARLRGNTKKTYAGAGEGRGGTTTRQGGRRKNETALTESVQAEENGKKRSPGRDRTQKPCKEHQSESIYSFNKALEKSRRRRNTHGDRPQDAAVPPLCSKQDASYRRHRSECFSAGALSTATPAVAGQAMSGALGGMLGAATSRVDMGGAGSAIYGGAVGMLTGGLNAAFSGGDLETAMVNGGIGGAIGGYSAYMQQKARQYQMLQAKKEMEMIAYGNYLNNSSNLNRNSGNISLNEFQFYTTEFTGLATNVSGSNFTPNAEDYIGYKDIFLANSDSNIKQFSDENPNNHDMVMNRDYENQKQNEKSSLQEQYVKTLLDKNISENDKLNSLFILNEQIKEVDKDIQSNRIGTSGCFVSAIANDLNNEFKRLGINKTVTVEELNNIANQKDANGKTLYTGASLTRPDILVNRYLDSHPELNLKSAYMNPSADISGNISRNIQRGQNSIIEVRNGTSTHYLNLTGMISDCSNVPVSYTLNDPGSAYSQQINAKTLEYSNQRFSNYTADKVIWFVITSK